MKWLNFFKMGIVLDEGFFYNSVKNKEYDNKIARIHSKTLLIGVKTAIIALNNE